MTSKPTQRYYLAADINCTRSYVPVLWRFYNEQVVAALCFSHITRFNAQTQAENICSFFFFPLQINRTFKVILPKAITDIPLLRKLSCIMLCRDQTEIELTAALCWRLPRESIAIYNLLRSLFFSFCFFYTI